MEVLAWVVMADHVHRVVYSEHAAVPVSRFTHALKRPFAVEVLNRWRALGAPILSRLVHGEGHRFWQTGGGFDRNGIGDEWIENIRYVHGRVPQVGVLADLCSGAVAAQVSEYRDLWHPAFV